MIERNRRVRVEVVEHLADSVRFLLATHDTDASECLTTS